jgi:pyrimidine deaminase RibD-like protein
LTTDSDIAFMTAAIERAKLSRHEDGPPRPKVGAVLVNEGKELGSAHRGELALGDHAEFGLLDKKLTHDKVAGGTLYTTLEPCTVRNPEKIPCAERIASRRLRRVVIGMLDPNQLICGKGVRLLRSRGIDVDLFPSSLMAQVEDQNRDFIRHQESIGQFNVEIAKSKLINPRFEDDLARLDGSFKVEAIASSDTVFIIPGHTIFAEVLDRYTCGQLREAIDIHGQGHPFKRAIIVSAETWKYSNWLTEKCPAISIGGPGPNEITKEWLDAAKVKGVQPFPIGSGHVIYLSEPRPRAALYGPLAADTKAAVERYIADPRGLKEFLANCWR